MGRETKLEIACQLTEHVTAQNVRNFFFKYCWLHVKIDGNQENSNGFMKVKSCLTILLAFFEEIICNS